MNDTNVSNSVLDRLTDEWDSLTPEAQKAARYVLENPHCVGVSTVREIAESWRAATDDFEQTRRRFLLYD